MKNMMMLIAMAILLVAGCDYESPLTEEHAIAIDPALIGVWEEIKVREGHPKHMFIIQFSETEYLIYSDGLYFRGYPIKIGGTSCVQVKELGNAGGEIFLDKNKPYDVVIYSLVDDQLTVKKLNIHKVDTKIKSPRKLRNAFLKHKDSENLFRDWEVFTRHHKEDN